MTWLTFYIETSIDFAATMAVNRKWMLQSHTWPPLQLLWSAESVPVHVELLRGSGAVANDQIPSFLVMISQD